MRIAPRIALPPTIALVMALGTLAACAPDPADIASCRKQFADHRQMLGENGNPGSKDFTPTMTARWDSLYAQFGKLGKSASADDCPGRFKTMSKEIKDLEAVLYKIDDYDVERQIRMAEADLDHANELRGSRTTDYVLITAFNRLRESGAAAQESLAPAVARADAVKPGDTSGRAEAMVALYNAAASNAAFADFKDALVTIGNYELHEE